MAKNYQHQKAYIQLNNLMKIGLKQKQKTKTLSYSLLSFSGFLEKMHSITTTVTASFLTPMKETGNVCFNVLLLGD